MNIDLINTRLMFLSSLAEEIAEKMKVESKEIKELIFEYRNSHYVLHKYNEKWIVSYPQKDKYWFDYIEDKPPINLNTVIDSIK